MGLSVLSFSSHCSGSSQKIAVGLRESRMITNMSLLNIGVSTIYDQHHVWQWSQCQCTQQCRWRSQCRVLFHSQVPLSYMGKHYQVSTWHQLGLCLWANQSILAIKGSRNHHRIVSSDNAA